MEKINIKDNTVSAKNQVTQTGKVYFLGDPNSNKRILILGNSITRHGIKEEIGWLHDWGMAASSLENDYVHKLFSKLEGKYYFMVRQASIWETDFNKNFDILSNFKSEKDFHADIVIFMIGENIGSVKDELNKKIFKEKYLEFIKYLSTKDNKIILTSCVWNNGLVDETIKELVEENNLLFFDKNYIGADTKFLAIGQFEHKGVSMHPGDLGMEEIASMLFKTIIKN